METPKTFANIEVRTIDYTSISRHLLVGLFRLIETVYLPEKREARIEYAVFKGEKLLERVDTLDKAFDVMIANGYKYGDVETA